MNPRCMACQGSVSPSFSLKGLFTLAIFRRELFPTVEQWLCQDCLSKLEKLTEGCYFCSRSLRNLEERFIRQYQEHAICFDCQRWIDWEENMGMGKILSLNRSVLAYNEFTQELIRAYKFRGDERLKYFFAALLLKSDVSKQMIDDQQGKGGIDSLIALPLSASRLQERGFNQSALVAQLVAQEWQLPYVEDYLLRTSEEGKQSKKNREERLAEMLQKFIKNPETKADIYNKNILIIDDIYTTGATIYAAAYTLKMEGAQAVFSLSFAR